MKVAIIGAGASGLTALKQCKDEGIEGVILEKENYIGGLWRFNAEPGKGGTVYRSTIINTSKEMMCFSDFPIPADFAPFMHNSKVVEYFEMYAKKFDLYKHIQYNTFVECVEPAKDYDQTGRWDVTTYSCDDPTTKVTTTYDGVIVGSGHHWDPRMPSFPGMDKFKGKQIHSHDYKDYKGFENQRVVIVGIGNSAVDLACELSHHCSQVYLSTRRGTWVFSRLGPGGLPVDHVFNRFTDAVIPFWMFEDELKKACNSRFDHEHYGLKSKHSILAQHPTMSDELPVRIICGSVKVKDNIESIGEHDISFVDGTVEKDIDAIFYCTGYKFGFPFLDPSIVEVKENKCDLFKFVFPPHLKHPTLAMVGFIQPLGALMPIAEMQARWVARVFAKKCALPSKKEMMADIKLKRDRMTARYAESPRHTIEADPIPYMDEVAAFVGCKPKLLKMFFTEPKLAIKCVFGPCTPPQFRLHGPHPWEGARKAIENVDNNVISAICTRQAKVIHRNSNATWYLLLAIILITFAFVVYRRNGDVGGAVNDFGETFTSTFGHFKGFLSTKG